MKKLQDYLIESEHWMESPSTGDHFDIELADDTLLETYVMGVDSEGGILLDSNQDIYSLLESWNMLEDDIDTDVEEDIDSDVNKHRTRSRRSTNDLEEMAPIAALAGGALARAVGSAVSKRNDDTNENQDPGEYDDEGDMAKNELYTMIRSARKLIGMLDNDDNMPEWTQKKITKATDYVDTAADYISSKKERGVMEQGVSAAFGETSPVARATLHRIMMRHPGMLAQHGPERVMKAVDDVADLVGDMDDIGSSDISGWVNMVQEILDSLDQGVAEGAEQLHPETLELIDEYISKIEPDADRDEMIQSVINGTIHTSELEYALQDDVTEAEYQGRKVPLGKPMRGDVAKSKVYVRDPKTGNVKKVNFGDPNMKIKKSNPARRKSFRARHNCDNPGPRTKARYWSCRAW